MDNGRRRAFRCVAEYIVFVLLLLAVVGVLLALVRLFGGTIPFPTSVRASTTLTEHTVILDPGHGGEDGGAVGHVNGREVHEKDINLSVSLFLRDLLEADGIHVVMTREKDVLLYDRNTNYQGRKKMLDLAARLAIGQVTENATFVSIHMNAFPQAQYKGLQVYYSPHDTRSALLAENIQTRVSGQLQPDNHRKTKCAGSDIYLLEQLRCPAVLVECGFMTNEEECASLCTTDYQKALAFLLFCSIHEYLNESPSTEPTGSAVALCATYGQPEQEIASEDLIFGKKYYIMDYQMSKTEVARHERNQNDLYLLGMRDEEPQVVGKVSLMRRLELLC